MLKSTFIAATLVATTLLTSTANATSTWPLQEWDYIYSNDWHQYEMTFYGNSYAYVEVVPEQGPVQVRIYDQNYNLVASSNVSSYSAYVDWNPIWTGTFYVEVENIHGYSQGYRIYSN